MSIQALSQSLAAKGRGGDSLLVHMAPSEVAGLQALARANGTSLSINPETGMPEAFKLKDILPTIAGIGLSFMGVPAWAIGLGTGVTTAATTGDLGKGLIAGLGAWGMSSLSGSLSNLATPGAPAPISNAVLAEGSKAVPGLTAAPSGVTVSPVTPTAPVIPSLKLDNLTSDGLTDLSRSVPTGSAGGSPLINAPAQPVAGGLPGLAGPTVQSTTLGNMFSGAENLAKSGEIGKFLLANKGSVAMSSLPLLMAASEVDEGKKPTTAQIRPYDLAIDNRSGDVARYAPGSSSEQQMLSYMFTPRDPYPASEADQKKYPFYAAAGGSVQRYENGGEVAATPMVNGIPITPGDIDTLRNIAMVQGLAGIPALDVSNLPINASRQTFEYAPRPLPSTREQLYQSYSPDPKDSTDYGKTNAGGIPSSLRKMALLAFRKGTGKTTNAEESGLGALMAKGGSTKKPKLGGTPYYKFADERLDKSMESAIEENFAAGGATLNDGDFVFDARTVSEIGNGSTEAGQKILAAKFNAWPVNGPMEKFGDGVSDSVRANIGGVQKARIANGEAVVPAKEVKRAGGAKKLYALMDKAHNARKKAGRGADTKIGKQLLA